MKTRFPLLLTGVLAAISLLLPGCQTASRTTNKSSETYSFNEAALLSEALTPRWQSVTSGAFSPAWTKSSDPLATLDGRFPSSYATSLDRQSQLVESYSLDPAFSKGGMLFLSAPNPNPLPVIWPIKPPVDPEGAIYPVWFGTSRKPMAGEKGVVFTPKLHNRITYGRVDVYVPKSHRFGETGNPFWKRLWRGRLQDDHLTITNMLLMKRDAFYDEVRQVIAAAVKSTNASQALIFLHGFNNTFEQTAIRAAQLGFDLKVPGPTAFFSWPSLGNSLDSSLLDAYRADEKSIVASEAAITDFLVEFSQKSKATNINLIAHSMGNRGLLGALQRITAKAELRGQVKFNQIFLAAPDVGRDDFLKVAKVCADFSKRTTLYTSSSDRALYASKTFNGVPRAGYFKPYTVIPEVDTIAVPNFNIDLLGHSYFAEAEALLYDIQSLMLWNAAPGQRIRILSAQEEGLNFWELQR
jgi:esterase/lipase superfamily enzyme